MPIYYACESETHAQEACLRVGGLYRGASSGGTGLFLWQTYTGACITTYVRPTAMGFDRFMVVYNADSESFETIQIEGAPPEGDCFVIGGDPDAPSDLLARYSRFRFEIEEDRRMKKSVQAQAMRSNNTVRLRHIRNKTVVVVAGKTIKHGTKGEVFWTGYSEHGVPRVGFRDAEGKRRYIDLDNVREAHFYPLLEQAS